MAAAVHQTSALRRLLTPAMTARERVRHHVGMPLTRPDFVTLVTSRVPEAEPTVVAYLHNSDELLLHLLVADLRRLAIQWFDEGQNEPLGRLLQVVEAGLREGDEHVENAVAVSFIEDTGWWDESMRPFIADWPAGLTDELDRQRRASP
jgi:hypothetical protein